MAGAPARHHRAGWRRRETFPAAAVTAANLADPVIRANKG